MKLLYIYRLLLSALCLALIASCDTENNMESPDKSYFMKLYGGDGDQSGVDMIALDIPTSSSDEY